MIHKQFVKLLFIVKLQLLFIVHCKWLIKTVSLIYKHDLDGRHEVATDV